MTGFLYLKARGDSATRPAHQFAPRDAKLIRCLEGDSEKECIWGWGGDRGDISYLADSDNSFLLLSGYVLEIENKCSFSSGREASRYVFQALRNLTSLAEMPDFLKRIYGSFAFLYHDSVKRITVCATDRVGSRPLWTAANDSALVISTQSSATAAALALREWDKAAIGSLLLYGGPVEPRRSIFAGVSRVSSGAYLRVHEFPKTQEYPWYHFRHQPDATLTRSEWVQEASKRLTAAAARILKLDPEPVIFLSGGTDSRLAAAAMKSAGGFPRVLTLGDSENLEVKVARRAAKALGFDHQVLLRDKLWYLRGLNRAVFESGGSYLWTHAHFSQAAGLLSERYGDAPFMLGDFCEAFSKLCCTTEVAAEGPWTPNQFSERFDQLPLPLYRPRDRAQTLSLLNPNIREEVQSSLKADLMTRYERLRPSAEDPLILADQFLRWETAGTIATFFMFQDLRCAASERNMMFDKDIHALLEVLPSPLRNSSNFGAELIAKLASAASWIPNSNSLLPMVFPQGLHQMSKKVKPLFGKVRRLLLRNPYTTTGSWPSRHILYANDASWRNRLSRVFDSGEWIDGSIFNLDACKNSWRSTLEGCGQSAGEIEKLVLLSQVSEMLSRGVSAYLGGAEVENSTAGDLSALSVAE